MLTYRLTVADLGFTHFAISPLGETSLSLWPLTAAAPAPHLRRWREHAVREADRYDAELLSHLLIGPERAIPDFLVPRPSLSRPTFSAELDRVRGTPSQRVQRELGPVLASPALPPRVRGLLADPTTAADTVATALERYRELTIAPFWEAMNATLEADITFRTHQLATGGPSMMLRNLGSTIIWTDDGALLITTKSAADAVVDGRGQGLLLTPSIMAPRVVSWTDVQSAAPWVTYPTRGAATLWEQPTITTPEALASLLGDARAKLLILLTEPMSTTQAARRLKVSPSAVSQHLQVLAANRLVERARQGRSVIYRQSDTAQRLLGQPMPGPRRPPTTQNL